MEQAALQKRRVRVKTARLDQLGSSSVRSSSKGRASRKKLVSLMVIASAMDALERGIFADAEVVDQLFKLGHALVAQQRERRVSKR